MTLCLLSVSFKLKFKLESWNLPKHFDLGNFIDEQYFKPAKYVPIKEIKAQEIDENIEEKPKKVKKVKVIKEEAPSALAYVRTLRKQTSNTQEKSEFHGMWNIFSNVLWYYFSIFVTMPHKEKQILRCNIILLFFT